MTFTVRSLLELPAVRTTSLTPGVGEDREISWAHVCELADPWHWLGQGALLMSTGIGVPATTDEQCDYVAALHEAGIAALAIGADMLKAPLTRPTLAFASHIGFPILETAYEIPFVAVAMAVSEGVKQEAELHIQATEQLYTALSRHPAEAPVEGLLSTLSSMMGGTLRLEQEAAAHTASAGSALPPIPGRIARTTEGHLRVALTSQRPQYLVWEGSSDKITLLQHAAGIVGNALTMKLASHRAEWLHGSLLLADLCESSVPSAPAAHFLAAYGVEPPYVLAVAPSEHPRDLLDATHIEFTTRRTPALATVKDGQVLALTSAGEASDQTFRALAADTVRIGVSAPFTELEGIETALRQARSAVIRNHQSGNVLKFEEHEPTSLFLPQGSERLRSIARQVLGPLTTYDAQRGTALTHTLQIFLEENRSWVRASERLYVHRQTLIARVSRIEKIIDRDLASMEDAAECWLAVQAAIGCGDLTPSSVQAGAASDEPDSTRDEARGSVSGADAAI